MHMAKILTFILAASVLAACGSSKAKEERYNRKIYLTQEDYMEDLSPRAEAERREVQPSPESEYIFNIQTEEKKNVYFFDDRTAPMVPGDPTPATYKKEKRLWEKPRRYSAAQYYGGHPAVAETEAIVSEVPVPDYTSADY